MIFENHKKPYNFTFVKKKVFGLAIIEKISKYTNKNHPLSHYPGKMANFSFIFLMQMHRFMGILTKLN